MGCSNSKSTQIPNGNIPKIEISDKIDEPFRTEPTDIFSATNVTDYSKESEPNNDIWIAKEDHESNPILEDITEEETNENVNLIETKDSKIDQPVVIEAPKCEEPKSEEPKSEEPKSEEPKNEETIIEKIEELLPTIVDVEEPKSDAVEPKAEPDSSTNAFVVTDE